MHPQQEHKKEEGVAVETCQSGQRPNSVSLLAHSSAGCDLALQFMNTTRVSSTSMRPLASSEDFVLQFAGLATTAAEVSLLQRHRQVQPADHLAPNAAALWEPAGALNPEASGSTDPEDSQLPGEPDLLCQSPRYADALPGDYAGSAETRATLGCESSVMMNDISETGSSNNNKALLEATVKLLLQLATEERQKVPLDIPACLAALMSTHSSGIPNHAVITTATEHKTSGVPPYLQKVGGRRRACHLSAREAEELDSLAVPPHTPSTAPSGFCLRGDEELHANTAGSPLQPLPPAARFNLNCMGGGLPASLAPPSLKPLQQAQLVASQQQQQEQPTDLTIPWLKKPPGFFEPEETAGPRSTNSTSVCLNNNRQGEASPFSPLPALGVSGRSIAAGSTAAGSRSVSPCHSVFSVTEKDIPQRQQLQQELLLKQREAAGCSDGSGDPNAFLSGLLNSEKLEQGQQQQLLNALTCGSPSPTSELLLSSSPLSPTNVLSSSFEGAPVPKLTAADLSCLVVAKGLREMQQKLQAESHETEGFESANRSFGELRPACCYFLLGKCDFSHSCVFWHPPPEADPSLVACKYGRVCNARHGRRVPYKELAAIIHTFVSRCPQLAPGESGRLYHYLRISRAQPQQHQQQLTGRPGPVLSPHIVNRFYGILDKVKGRDLSAVNSVWFRAFGETFPYAMYGFEQLRAAVASIPGIRLTTRGTDLIISKRSRVPLFPPVASSPGSSATETIQTLGSFAKSAGQTQQELPLTAAISASSHVLFNTKGLSIQGDQHFAAVPSAPQALLSCLAMLPKPQKTHGVS